MRCLTGLKLPLRAGFALFGLPELVGQFFGLIPQSRDLVLETPVFLYQLGGLRVPIVRAGCGAVAEPSGSRHPAIAGR